ncbi:hypothetical protein J2Y67_004387 [Neobacillus niacini]|nr:hypothetical protein [Neobacillus niacini]
MMVMILEYAPSEGTESDTKKPQSRRKIISFLNRLTRFLMNGIRSVIKLIQI